MREDFRVRFLPLLAVAGLALALGACSATTYGTGVAAGEQTISDLENAGKLVNKQANIDFTPRPPIVAPPSNAALPLPGSGSDPAVAANWPDDPDLQAAKIKAQIASAQANGTPIKIASSAQTPLEDQPLIDPDSRDNFKVTPEQSAAIRAARLAQNSVPVGADGKPVRQYLSDPPSDYLQADPTAPPPSVASIEAAKKPLLKWPWQWFQK